MSLKNNLGPILAVAILAGTVVWIFAGGNHIVQAQHNEEAPEIPVSIPKISTEQTVKKQVQAQILQQQLMADSLSFSGITQPSKSIKVSAGLAGKVVKIYAEKGDFVKAGETILAIDTRALKAQMKEQEALLKQRQIEYRAVTQLKVDNYSSEVNEATAKAALATAEAQLKASQVSLENARLIAPFSGIINTLDVEEGQLVSMNEEVGQLVAINPLVIEISVPQKHIHRLQIGASASIDLGSNTKVTGKVTYISSVADVDTRTIAIEIEIDNQDQTILAGVTAYVELTLPEQKAHAFSPALLTLDGDGNTAVKILTLDNKVEVATVEVLKSERDQIWVSGLPPRVNLITVGQGFTKAGDVVEAIYQDK